MSELIPQAFIKDLMSVGIISYHEHENMWQLAKLCAGDKSLKLPWAAVGTVGGLAATAGGATAFTIGAVTVTPVVAGILAGMVAGTFACVALNVTIAQELRILADGLRMESDSQ